MPDSDHGLLLLDKPKGFTSRRCVDVVSRIVGVRRAGHAGSLDPMATGVLPVLFGKATRLSEYLMRTDKEYLFTVTLGSRTDTGDAEGKIIQETPVPQLAVETIRECLAAFLGQMKQIPPAYSAKKVHGRRAYAIAREGGTPRLSPVKVWVYQFSLLDFQSPHLFLRVVCSHGTYIRTLCEDLGAKFGCVAHVTQLRRSRVGPFSEESCVSLEDLSESENPFHFTRSMSEIISFMPSITVGEKEILALNQGKTVAMDKTHEMSAEKLGIGEMKDAEKARIRVVDRKGKLVAVCRLTGVLLNELKPDKVFTFSE